MGRIMQPDDSPEGIEAQMRVLASVIDDLSRSAVERSPFTAPLPEPDAILPAADIPGEAEAALVTDAPPLDPAAEPTGIVPAFCATASLRLTTDHARLADFMAAPVVSM